MRILAGLLATVVAIALSMHRDERGQLNLFKDLFGKTVGTLEGIRDWIVDLGNKLWAVIANGAAAIRDRLREVQDALWERLGDLGQTVWNAAADGANKVFAAVANGAAAVAGAAVDLGNKLFAVAANAASAMLGGVLDLGNKLFAAVANAGAAILGGVFDLGNKVYLVAANGAVAIVTGVGSAAERVWGALTDIAHTTAAAGERTADGLQDVASAAKDLPAEIKDALAEVFDTAFGVPADFADKFISLAERVAKGEVSSIDDMLALVKGNAPSTSWTERIIYLGLFLPMLITIFQQAGAVLAEPPVQRFRADHPSALLDVTELRDLILRRIGNEDNWVLELRRLGLADHQIDGLRQLWLEIPPPSDLIRMAVREAFSPDVVARFGQHDDFPEQFATLAGQQGIEREFALAYWAAHWDLPSSTQGFEMFHRGVIDADTLQLLLRALDVMPFWRGKLTDIAYNVVTRVDTRRLYASGVWTREQVLRSYLDQGYKPEDAESLTAWTVTSYGEDAPTARDLTRTAIEQAVRQGRLSDLEAVDALQQLGYDEDEAAFLIASVRTDVDAQAADEAERSVREVTQSTVLKAYRDRIMASAEAEELLAGLGYQPEGIELLLAVQDFEAANELTALRARVTEQRFRHALVNDAAALGELVTAGFSQERAELTVQRWVIQFAEKTRELTEAQLNTAMQSGLIDEATYVLRVTALGYAEEDALILLANRGRASTEQVRQLSQSTIAGLYKRGIISREDAAGRLVAVGFTPEDTELLLIAADQDLAKTTAGA